MRVRLDGRRVGTFSVRSRRGRAYSRALQAGPGRHLVAIRFLNPRKTRRCKRKLVVGAVRLTQRKPQPAAPAPPPPQPAQAAPPEPLFTNPVHTGDGFADPMVLDAGGGRDDYWGYATGERFFVARSSDLVHWAAQPPALASRPAWADQTGGWNPWSPSVIEKDEPCPGAVSGPCFVMFFTAKSDALDPDVNCIGVATSPIPGGPFTDRGQLDREDGALDLSDRPIGCGDDAGYSNIDASPFVDADGTAYLYLSTGHKCEAPAAHAVCPWDRTISVIPLTADLLEASGARQPLFDGDAAWEAAFGTHVVENPWPRRRGDVYELLYSGGDWTATYGMGYATASSPTGPFTKSAANPILADTPAVRSAGGGSLVSGPKGGTWAAYHGRAGSLSEPRVLRLDRVVEGNGGSVDIDGPSTTPQPLP